MGNSTDFNAEIGSLSKQYPALNWHLLEKQPVEQVELEHG